MATSPPLKFLSLVRCQIKSCKGVWAEHLLQFFCGQWPAAITLVKQSPGSERNGSSATIIIDKRALCLYRQMSSVGCPTPPKTAHFTASAQRTTVKCSSGACLGSTSHRTKAGSSPTSLWRAQDRGRGIVSTTSGTVHVSCLWRWVLLLVMIEDKGLLVVNCGQLLAVTFSASLLRAPTMFWSWNVSW